jgi:hypothetical protein
MSDAEVHRELCAAVNLMSEGTVRQWCRILKMGEQMFTMKSEVVGRPSIVQIVDQKNL